MSNKNYRVYLGGDVGIEDMATDSNIADVVATGEVGWYIQESDYYGMISNGDIAAINKNFGYSNVEVEINLQNASNIASWVSGTYIPEWIDEGLNITEWNSIINFADSNWYTNFIATVDAVKAEGVDSVAPIYSPNTNEGIDGASSDDFATSSNYSQLREAALYGGGLTLDTPPWYAYVDGGTNYYKFSSEEIKWANSENIRSTVILSPSGDGFFFLGDTMRFIHTIENLGYVPKEWVVENYGSDSDVIGTTLDPNSLASVAKWVAEEAETTTYTPSPIVGAIQENMTVNNSDTLVLYVSEDAYKGDATFNITIDGVTYKTGETATASHTDGDTTTITITGNFSSGVHDLNIWYSNDYSDSSGDRNLYIDKVTLNGTEISSLQSMPGEYFYDTAIYGSGKTESFDTTSTTPKITGTSSADDKVNIYYALVGGSIYTLAGSTTADSNGDWSYSFSTLKTGSYSIEEQSIGVNGVASAMSSRTVINILDDTSTSVESSVLTPKNSDDITLSENTYFSYNATDKINNTVALNGYSLSGSLTSVDTLNVSASTGSLSLSGGIINANGVYSNLFLNSSTITLYASSTGYGEISNSSGSINLTLTDTSNFSLSNTNDANIYSDSGSLTASSGDDLSLSGDLSYLSLSSLTNTSASIALDGYGSLYDVTGNIAITENKGSNLIITDTNIYATLNNADMTLISGSANISSGEGNSYVTENGGLLNYLANTDMNTTFTINDGDANITYNKGYTATTIDMSGTTDVNITGFSISNGLLVIKGFSGKTSDITVTGHGDNTILSYGKSEIDLVGISSSDIHLLSSIDGKNVSDTYGSGAIMVGLGK